MTSTWACKNKPNGKFRARLYARWYEKVDGDHYERSPIASPITNYITIRVVMIRMPMENWYGDLIDSKGAFLMGKFDNNEIIYLRVLEGLKKC